MRGDFGSWYVIASHPDHLGDVLEVLSTRERQNPPLAGRFDSAGSLNGIRVARHLRSWMDQSADLAAPNQEEAFRASLGLLAGFGARTTFPYRRRHVGMMIEAMLLLILKIDSSKGLPVVLSFRIRILSFRIRVM